MQRGINRLTSIYRCETEMNGLDICKRLDIEVLLGYEEILIGLRFPDSVDFRDGAMGEGWRWRSRGFGSDAGEVVRN